MKTRNCVLRVKNGRNGLDVYIVISGQPQYLMTTRRSEPLWEHLHNGATLEELKRFRSKGGRKTDHLQRRISHLIKVANEYIRYECAA